MNQDERASIQYYLANRRQIASTIGKPIIDDDPEDATIDDPISCKIPKCKKYEASPEERRERARQYYYRKKARANL